MNRVRDARLSATTGSAPAGLVISATTRRVSETTGKPAGQGDGRSLAFPSPELVTAAAGLFTRRAGWTGHEGPRPRITIAPGVVSVSWPDAARQERRHERTERTRRALVDEDARYFAEHEEHRADPEPSREVVKWSRKSRARMVRTLAELDYGPLLRTGLRLPMTTLTYPGDWEVVAPDGKAVKRHLDQFRKRFERAWGMPFTGLWKLEFQRRGAPHIHLWGAQPVGTAGELRRMTQRRYRPAVGDALEYRAWLGVVWADVVGHPDPEQRRRHLLAGTAVDGVEGDRMTDPKRLAVYFTKHGSFAAKEYQHVVPEAWQAPGKGPGRFWGYWGLQKATAAVEVTPDEAVTAARTLRRYARSQGVTREVEVRRVDTRTGVVRSRKVRRKVRRIRSLSGFLCVNDGPALAADVARAVELAHGPGRGPIRHADDLQDGSAVTYSDRAGAVAGRLGRIGDGGQEQAPQAESSPSGASLR